MRGGWEKDNLDEFGKRDAFCISDSVKRNGMGSLPRSDPVPFVGLAHAIQFRSGDSGTLLCEDLGSVDLSLGEISYSLWL